LPAQFNGLQTKEVVQFYFGRAEVTDELAVAGHSKGYFATGRSVTNNLHCTSPFGEEFSYLSFNPY
jgi:hypothetical protein